MQKTFAVIGDPIDHSLSPNIHSAAFRDMGLDCSYIAYKIPRGELEEGIDALKKIKIDGFNVTIPHKVSMMRYLDKTDESCSIVGAVNTVANNDGLLKGYNTDMDGFLDPFKKKNLPIRGARVLLLGAGGAARAIVAAFAKEQARKVTIANRTVTNAEDLSGFSKKIGLDAVPATMEDVRGVISEYDIIVNATSVGLKNEQSPISFEGIDEETVVCDIVYMPMNTDFIRKAREKNATIIYGYEMLLGQAAISFEIWHGVQAPYDAMKRSLLGGM